MTDELSIGRVLQRYFEHHLRCHKGVKPATERSYREAIRLFLQFVATEKRCKLTRLNCADLTSDRVLQFLDHLEAQRDNAITSRNQRLAALRSFFDYLAERRPESLVEAHRIAGIPVKRTPPPRTHFLQRDEI